LGGLQAGMISLLADACITCRWSKSQRYQMLAEDNRINMRLSRRRAA